MATIMQEGDLVQQFLMVPIEDLRESKTNPRRHQDPVGFAELVKSVEQRGVLVPLLVRAIATASVTHKHTYEIVSGWRRYKAAQKVGVKELPVRIMPLTDIEVLEIQVIENLQREDVHPLDEARGYAVLMEKAKYDVESIAAKVGKSASYVYQRLKLTELIETAQKSFLEGRLTAGHAILIARLQPGDQKEAIKACFDQHWEDRLPGPRSAISVRQLMAWIDRELHLDLHSAPFKKDDAELVEKAGPCTTCPKRTGFSPALFPDISKKDTCTDRQCFDQKLRAHIELQKKEIAAKGEKAVEISTEYRGDPKKGKSGPLARTQWEPVTKDKCESTKKGIVVQGMDEGKVLDICTDKKCKKHHHQGFSQPEKPKEKERHKKEAEKQQRESRIRVLTLNAILEKVPALLKGEDIKLVARAMYGRLWHDFQKQITKRHGLEPRKMEYGQRDYTGPMVKKIATMNDAGINRFLMEIAMTPNLDPNADHYAREKGERLSALATRYKINVQKIRADMMKNGAGKKRSQTSPKPAKVKKAVKKR